MTNVHARCPPTQVSAKRAVTTDTTDATVPGNRSSQLRARHVDVTSAAQTGRWRRELVGLRE
jgi:predicted secreted protein